MSAYRSRDHAGNVIGLSLGYEREALLARGVGLEHLREMLLRLARPLLRQGACIAYGGHWRETDDNFTYDLLRLVNAEQEDNNLADPETSLRIGHLYCHSSWPYYLEITPHLEAQWIKCCRIVRITQEACGFEPEDCVPDREAGKLSTRAKFNRSAGLSKMRRLMLDEHHISLPGGTRETIPAVSARVVMGGKLRDYSGFMPGIFEEILTALQKSRPVYLLGGFGGAAELLAQAILQWDQADKKRPPELAIQWHEDNSKGYREQFESGFPLPAGLPEPRKAFDDLWDFVMKARNGLAATLKTGLSDDDTKQLLTTRDMNTAVRLVRDGLKKHQKPSPSS